MAEQWTKEKRESLVLFLFWYGDDLAGLGFLVGGVGADVGKGDAGTDKGLEVFAVLLAVDIDINVRLLDDTQLDSLHIELYPLDGGTLTDDRHRFLKVLEIVVSPLAHAVLHGLCQGIRCLGFPAS